MKPLKQRFHEAALAVIGRLHPSTTANQRSAIAEKVYLEADVEGSAAALGDDGAMTLFTTSGDWILESNVTAHVSKNPQSIRAAGTAEQTTAYLISEGEKEAQRVSGRSLLPSEKIVIARQVAEMDADARLARVPADHKFDPKPAPVAVPTSAVKKFSEMNSDEMDAQIQKRWGHPPGTLMPSKRESFRQALIGQDAKAPTTPHGDAAAALGKNFLDLPPGERISIYREAEAAKKRTA